ncbi:MAG: ABC transporter substrate-binding protein [Candidatus Tectimicrobiota bacterium]
MARTWRSRLVVSLVLWSALTAAAAWAQTPKLERLRIAAAPLGWDTNYSWLQSRSGQIDKRPAFEYLVGIDRATGTYVPELAEKWAMAPDGKSWTFWLRQGVTFHEQWGAFSARDVRHSLFLLTQPESVQTDSGFWRAALGIAKSDSVAEVLQKVEQGVEIVNDHQVVMKLQFAVPELIENVSANADLVMESKARWDAGGKDLYGQKVVGTGPFAFVERKVGSYVLYKRVENHWRHTPEYKELEFRWVAEGVTRLATLVAGEVHISDVDRALHQDARAKGMQIVASTKHAMQHQWHFGGLYFATPDKLDTKVPFTDKRVRQAMNKAINRPALAQALFNGKVAPLRIPGYHPELDEVLWPGIWNPDWDTRFADLYGYDPVKAKALLAEAGFKNGFEFTLYLYTLPGLPEQVDIGQALALDFQAIGLRPKLVEIDFPRVREQYRTKTIHGALFPARNSYRALEYAKINTKARDSVVNTYEHPYLEERLALLGQVVDNAERTRLLREMGEHIFQDFASMPLFFLHANAAVNPKYVAEYTFPGVITGYFTHLEYVKLAR